jgi:hypothetical protein
MALFSDRMIPEMVPAFWVSIEPRSVAGPVENLKVELEAGQDAVAWAAWHDRGDTSAGCDLKPGIDAGRQRGLHGWLMVSLEILHDAAGSDSVARDGCWFAAQPSFDLRPRVRGGGGGEVGRSGGLAAGRPR